MGGCVTSPYASSYGTAGEFMCSLTMSPLVRTAVFLHGAAKRAWSPVSADHPAAHIHG